MKNRLIALFIGLAILPSVALATPTSWDYATGVLQPLLSQATAQIKAAYFTATSTATSTFPNLLSTNTRINGKLYDGAGSPGTNGYVLQTSGTGVTWSPVSGDGVSNWLNQSGSLRPSTTVGISVFSSSTIGGGTDVSGLIINGRATSTLGVVFGQDSAPTYSRGLLTYDLINESLTFFNNDSDLALQIGQESWTRVYNNSGSSIANCSAVSAGTSAVGMLPTVSLVSGALGSTSIGLATEAISNNATGTVTSYGLVRGCNTLAWTSGTTLYASTTAAGALTSTRPSAPNFAIRIGTVGVVSASVGTIYVNSPTTGLGLGTANQLLGMNSAGTAQEYKSIATGTANADFNVIQSANTITFNMPDAGAAARGLVTTGSQTFAGAKTFSTSVISPIHSSSNADPADAGIVRLGNAEAVAWEAAPAGTDGTLQLDSSERLTITGIGAFMPSANDGATLGVSGTAWADLFLASGAVMDFAAGNVVVTHSSGVLTMGTGELRITTPGTGSTAVVTVGAAQTLTSKTLTAPIITSAAITTGTYLGVNDFTNATLRIPYAASPTTTTNGDCGVDSTSNQFKCFSNSAIKVYGNGNIYKTFSYATSTAWTGTTTMPLGTAYIAETWNGVQCFTDVGTVNVDFGDGTNFTNATTSKALNPVPIHTFSSNNTFTAGETRYIRMGTAASSPTRLSCTVSLSITSD